MSFGNFHISSWMPVAFRGCIYGKSLSSKIKDIEILSQSIHLLAEWEVGKSSWLSLIYGHPAETIRRELWNELRDVASEYMISGWLWANSTNFFQQKKKKGWGFIRTNGLLKILGAHTRLWSCCSE